MIAARFLSGVAGGTGRTGHALGERERAKSPGGAEEQQEYSIGECFNG